jgi:hypothetical protein
MILSISIIIVIVSCIVASLIFGYAQIQNNKKSTEVMKLIDKPKDESIKHLNSLGYKVAVEDEFGEEYTGKGHDILLLTNNDIVVGME